YGAVHHGTRARVTHAQGPLPFRAERHRDSSSTSSAAPRITATTRPSPPAWYNQRPAASTASCHAAEGALRNVTASGPRQRPILPMRGYRLRLRRGGIAEWMRWGRRCWAVRDTVSGPIMGWRDIAGEHAHRVDTT